MSPSKESKQNAQANGNAKEDLKGEHNEWKFEAPYKVHENDPNFKALYEGSCHCGKVQYQLNREKPLSAKYCHCTTCQVLHGEYSFQFLDFYRMKTATDADQERHSNGQPSSTRKISTSPTDTMISYGMIQARRQPDTSFHARSPARIAVLPSWMRAGT